MTLRTVAKEELIYTRISSALKDRLAIEAHKRGEAEAVIVREALNEYFDRRETSGSTTHAFPQPVRPEMNERITYKMKPKKGPKP